MTAKISVIVCTYNRAAFLRATIHSILSQSLEKSRYAIVVVDNASIDDTATVVREFQDRPTCPEIIFVQEPTQGLGHARNTGCKHAKGRYLAFIDDDCTADERWLQSLVSCYENVLPEPWSVGGPVMPLYNRPKPGWFKDEYETDTWGEQPRFLRKGESFTGCNMSFRKDVIEKFGGFDVTLGMKGERLALAEETNLFRTIWSRELGNNRLYYSPQALVYHMIDPYKMTVSYQLKRAFAAGQASYAMAQTEPMGKKLFLFVGSIALMQWHSIKAAFRIRSGSLRRWAVEELRPVAGNIGRLLAFIGIRISFRQRNTLQGSRTYLREYSPPTCR